MVRLCCRLTCTVGNVCTTASDFRRPFVRIGDDFFQHLHIPQHSYASVEFCREHPWEIQGKALIERQPFYIVMLN